jgi:hypothetical protein
MREADGRLVEWTDARLARFPAIDIAPDTGLCGLRVTYSDEDREGMFSDDADYLLPFPVTGALDVAQSISSHAGVYAVGLYEIDDMTGLPGSTPVFAFIDGYSA